jgi:SPP1 family holin
MLLNQLLAAFGKSPLPFSDEQVDTFVSTLLTAVSAIWAWWRNNSFTKAAIKADEYMKELKAK